MITIVSAKWVIKCRIFTITGCELFEPGIFSELKHQNDLTATNDWSSPEDVFPSSVSAFVVLRLLLLPRYSCKNNNKRLFKELSAEALKYFPKSPKITFANKDLLLAAERARQKQEFLLKRSEKPPRNRKLFRATWTHIFVEGFEALTLPSHWASIRRKHFHKFMLFYDYRLVLIKRFQRNNISNSIINVCVPIAAWEAARENILKFNELLGVLLRIDWCEWETGTQKWILSMIKISTSWMCSWIIWWGHSVGMNILLASGFPRQTACVPLRHGTLGGTKVNREDDINWWH